MRDFSAPLHYNLRTYGKLTSPKLTEISIFGIKVQFPTGILVIQLTIALRFNHLPKQMSTQDASANELQEVLRYIRQNPGTSIRNTYRQPGGLQNVRWKNPVR
jgi:hypothetical protein